MQTARLLFLAALMLANMASASDFYVATNGSDGNPGTKANPFAEYTLSFDTPTDPVLQSRLEAIDSDLRARYDMTTNQTAIGLLDLRRLRLAMLHPDRGEYAASVAKIGILLAYFQLHPEAATNLDSATRHDLGLMVKISSNEM